MRHKYHTAARLARSACPDFLFNHCLRTYLLGALSLEAQRLDFDAELAFTASSRTTYVPNMRLISRTRHSWSLPAPAPTSSIRAASIIKPSTKS